MHGLGGIKWKGGKMKANGVQLVVGQSDTELWHDEIPKKKVFPIGLKLAIHWGPLRKKVVKYWRLRWGQNWDTAPNPWKNPDDCWFEYSMPFFIGPYISISIFKFGFYCGFKIDDDDGLIPTIRSTFRRR